MTHKPFYRLLVNIASNIALVAIVVGALYTPEPGAVQLFGATFIVIAYGVSDILERVLRLLRTGT